MQNHLVFAIGSFSGCALACFCFAVYHSRKVQELRDEFSSVREAIRRRAYAMGYEVAKTGGIKNP